MCSRGAPSLSNQRLFVILERAWKAIEKHACDES